MTSPGDAVSARHLDAADRVGQTLVDDAFWHADRCTWVGAEYEPGPRGWETIQRSCAHDLYGGTSGIALFLAHLAAATGDADQRRTAAGALRHALSHLDDRTGLYEGSAGTALAAVRAAALLADDELRERGSKVAADLAECVRMDPLAHGHDVVSGAAGAALALVALAAALERPEWLDPADVAGQALLRSSLTGPLGACWPPPIGAEPGDLPLCGLAHGASGIAWAMVELNAVTGEPQYADLAAAAVRWERSWFDRGSGCWPDRRRGDDDGGGPDGAFWCHGAVGIGLTRLRMHELSGSDAALAEAGAAIQAARVETLRGTPELETGALAGNFSLCHGLGGIVELLVSAAETLAHDEHLHAARRLGDHGLAAAERTGAWRCGLPEGGQAPGLMLGLAGIGAVLLRLAHPSLMPRLGLIARPQARIDDPEPTVIA